MDRTLALLELGLALPTALALVRIAAPYGRHARAGWGPTLPARLGWLLMESPASLWFLAVYLAGPARASPAPLALLALWQLHYLHRAFVYPLRMRPGGRMPVAVALLAVLFNLLNGFTNARATSGAAAHGGAWLGDPRFLAGAAVFLAGFALNLWSDRALARLRAPGETGHRVPRGGPFEWVSCPNYLGEVVEWAGWALASWSLAGLAFAVYTAANLVPRARSHHTWYRARFPAYPPGRRAILPFLL